MLKLLQRCNDVRSFCEEDANSRQEAYLCFIKSTARLLRVVDYKKGCC